MAEQKALGVKVERLLSMLMEAEDQMNEGTVVMDKREMAGKDSSCEQLTQQLSLCKASPSKSLHSATGCDRVEPLFSLTSVLCISSSGSPVCSDGSIQ